MSSTAVTTAVEILPHATEVSERGHDDDIELVGIQSVVSREAGEHDPLLLRDRIKCSNEISKIRSRGRSHSKLASFYEGQNDHIGNLLKPFAVHTAEGKQEEQDMALKVKLAVNISFVCNTALAVLQLYAAISSMSLALFASCIDAGKFSLPTSPGNIVYGFIMGGVNVILIVFAIQEIVTHKSGETKQLHVIPLACVCAAWAVKFMLFLYCFAIRGASSQVQVLWEDHRNDLFTNAFSILTNAGGAKLRWWIDPAGATVLACVIILLWCRTVYEQFTFLAGITAPSEYVSLVTYKAMTFSDDIKLVDTVRVYHSGPKYVVEVDIVLDPEMPLWKAHDISQDLQDQIEALPDVDRCFVHVDHEVDHKPEHRKQD